jgi:hypothetical protein
VARVMSAVGEVLGVDMAALLAGVRTVPAPGSAVTPIGSDARKEP